MIYWDHNATTPCAPEVVNIMSCYLSVDFGTPSSSHLAGRKAAQGIETARHQVAELAGCRPKEIVFTSGATESNNLIFLGVLLSDLKDRKQIIVSSIEHKSVLNPAALLGERGFELIQLPVTTDGVVDLGAAERMISGQTLLVSVQAVNNEIGTIQPLEGLAELAHKHGAFFHTDAAQALGKIPVDLNQWGCDLASFSAHKLYGPKGAGALFIRGGVGKWPWVHPFQGGSQEGGLRPGTCNVPAIAGFGEACRLASESLREETSRLNGLRDFFENSILSNIPHTYIHSRHASRLPGISSLAFKEVPADLLIDNLEMICIGKGSACTAGAIEGSHVLASMGCDDAISNATIRVSFGMASSFDQIKLVIEKMAASVSVIREKLGGGVHASK